MTRTRRLLGGLAFGYANQVLLTLVGMWLTAFLLGRLGRDEYGLWLVATRLLGYLMLLDLGVVALLPRDLAFATGKAGGVARAESLADVVARTAAVVAWQLPVVALAAAGMWLGLPDEWADLRRPLGIVMAAFVLLFPFRIFHSALTGLQDLAALGATTTVTWAVGTATTVLLVLAGWGLQALAVGWVTQQAASGLSWWFRLRRQFPTAVPATFRWLRARDAGTHLARGIWISISQIAQTFLTGTDVLVIGKVLGPSAVVPYFCTGKVLTVLANQPQLFAQTAQPALSELRTGASRERLVQVVAALTQVILMASGGIVCVVLLTNEGFVTWWVGPEQYAGAGLTALLLAAMLLRHWNMTAVYSLFAFGYDRRISLTSLADGAVTVAASVALVRGFGLTGAAVGSLVGVVMVALPANLAGLRRATGVPLSALLAPLFPWAWRFLLAAGSAAALARVWTPRGVLQLVVAGAAAGLVYAALNARLALQDPVGVYLRPRVAPLIRWAPSWITGLPPDA
ncbi:MAG TPA: oligosaccharide flippase family protein [Gemmatimonadales bacterium]|nr:oligosaccharide flippase family protein [Gemmatimonadales bacterium]